MWLLMLGVLLWSLVHLIPSIAPGFRAHQINRLGENAYKGIFTAAIALSLVMIVLGWRSTTPEFLFIPPPGMRHPLMLLVVLAFIVFGASLYPSRIKRLVRHPQLTGVLLWAVAHVLLNGDNRSIVLFGGLGLWAIVSMVFINRRDGVWVKPEAGSMLREIGGLVVSLVAAVVVVFLHPWIAGVSVAG